MIESLFFENGNYILPHHVDCSKCCISGCTNRIIKNWASPSSANDIWSKKGFYCNYHWWASFNDKAPAKQVQTPATTPAPTSAVLTVERQRRQVRKGLTKAIKNICCVVCHGVVEGSESTYGGQQVHNNCFKCSKCGTALSSSTASMIDKKLVCERCK